MYRKMTSRMGVECFININKNKMTYKELGRKRTIKNKWIYIPTIKNLNRK